MERTPLQIRSLAAEKGFHDPEYRGELAILFDGAGRKRRYLRKSGISLEEFGEILFDRGLTRERPTPDEVYHLLDRAFTPVAKRRKRRTSKRTVLSQIDRKAQRAKRNRMRKHVCDACGMIAYGSTVVLLDCGRCHVAMRRVDPTFSEVMQQACAMEVGL